MTCGRYIALSQPPYDEQTIQSVCQLQDCAGVGAHFAANPIAVGDYGQEILSGLPM